MFLPLKCYLNEIIAQHDYWTNTSTKKRGKCGMFQDMLSSFFQRPGNYVYFRIKPIFKDFITDDICIFSKQPACTIQFNTTFFSDYLNTNTKNKTNNTMRYLSHVTST